MEKDSITKSDAQKNLAITWMVASAVLITLFFIQTLVGNKYPNQSDEAWDWLIPHVVPTLTLMIGVLVAHAQSDAEPSVGVRRFYYKLTLWAVIFYFIILFGVVFTAPLDYSNNETYALDHLKKSTKLLNVIQSCVTLTLSIFFVSGASTKQT